MSTEIVRRLREACTGGIHCQCSYRLAADEIERLHADVVALRDALREHAIVGLYEPASEVRYRCDICEAIWPYTAPEQHQPGCLAARKG